MRTLLPKSEARRLVVERRNEVSKTELDFKTSKIIERLSNTDDYVYAKTVHCYISSRPGEVNTRKLIEHMTGWGKAIAVPKLNRRARRFSRSNFTGWDNLVKNNEGYWEPKISFDEDLSDIDLFIIPALAVSVHGQRVGYGGGYYDKLLRESYAPKYVLAFEFQIFDYIESLEHDVKVDKIITERRIINTRDPNRGY